MRTQTTRLLAAILCLAALIAWPSATVPTARAAAVEGSGDLVTGIARDGQGNIYVVGASSSGNVPVTAGAAQPKMAGESDAFVASYDAGGRPRWATYLDGSSTSSASGVAVDAAGNVYVTGTTWSYDFPVSGGAAQQSCGSSDPPIERAFVTSYTASGRIRWSTCLGGSGNQQDLAMGTEGQAVAVDGQGNVYVTGSTDVADFPVTPGAAQPRLHRSEDNCCYAVNAFVASYSANGRRRWSSFLGGEEADAGLGIAASRQGDVYVTGYTRSYEFPVTRGGTACNLIGLDASNAFIARFTASGRLRWSTCLGGTRTTYIGPGPAADLTSATGVALDGNGGVYVTGFTTAPDLRLTPGAQQSRLGGAHATNAFVARYDAAGRPRWITYLGGSRSDVGSGIAVDGQGEVIVTGATTSRDFPVTPGAPNPHFGGGSANAVAARYDPTGRLRWATYLKGPGGTFSGEAVVAAAEDAFSMAGNTNAGRVDRAADRFSGLKDAPADDDNAVVARYDAIGQLLWTAFPGGPIPPNNTWKYIVGGVGGLVLAAVLIATGIVLSRRRKRRERAIRNEASDGWPALSPR